MATGSSAARRGVLAHELFHVRRRDWLWLLGEEAIRAAFWFHPAMWWLISRAQLARETVVDELSILATNARRPYLDTLLAYADSPSLTPATAFSRRRHLIHRITLLSREGTMSTARMFTASAVLAVALVAAGFAAVRAFPLQQPPRDPVPGVYTEAQAAVFNRTLDRLRGALAREPDAPDLRHQLAVTLGTRASQDRGLPEAERQRDIAEAVASENHALAFRPEYVPALTYKKMLLELQAGRINDPARREAILAEANRLGARAAEVQRDHMPPPPPPPPPPPLDPAFDATVARLHPVHIGGDIRAPRKVVDVQAVYPPEAIAAHIHGLVILRLVLDEDGRVADGRVIRSVPGLDGAAEDAVRQWVFTPTLVNNQPVPLLVTVTVNFTLK